MTQTSALLYVQLDPPPDNTAAFDGWYEEHMARRRALPGFESAYRYAATEAEGPRYLAVYELADLSALESPEYLAMRVEEAASEREQVMMASAPLVVRRLYRCIDTDEPWAAAWTKRTPFVMSVALEPPPDRADDFHAWYREEHSPMLMATPGWRRIRRYEQVDGDGPRFMALHELESLGGFQTDSYKAAVNTPWRERVIGTVVRRERYIFRAAGSSG